MARGYPFLKSAELERLSLLSEELGEVEKEVAMRIADASIIVGKVMQSKAILGCVLKIMAALDGTVHDAAKDIERLAELSRELGQAQQAIGKIKRHGYDSEHPFETLNGNNRDNLEKELGDLLGVIRLMVANDDVSMRTIEYSAEQKLDRVKDYLHYRHKFPEGSES